VPDGQLDKSILAHMTEAGRRYVDPQFVQEADA
jgi:hypothetical protein